MSLCCLSLVKSASTKEIIQMFFFFNIIVNHWIKFQILKSFLKCYIERMSKKENLRNMI